MTQIIFSESYSTGFLFVYLKEIHYDEGIDQ
jgi:hypothetical protein